MDRSSEIRSSGSFICKKWTLFTFAAIGIVVTIIVAVLANKLLDNYINDYTTDSSERRTLKSSAMVWIWILSAINILFHLVGLMGSYKEHYCMSMTYAVLTTLGAIGSISFSVKYSYYWGQTVIYFIICIISYAFTYDLRRIRSIQFNTPAMIFIGDGSGNPTSTIINVAPSQYPQPYLTSQYNPQFGQSSGGPATFNPPPYSSSENKTFQ